MPRPLKHVHTVCRYSTLATVRIRISILLLVEYTSSPVFCLLIFLFLRWGVGVEGRGGFFFGCLVFAV